MLFEAEPRLYRDFYALTHHNFRTALRLFVNTLVPESDLRVALRLLHQDELAGQTERGGEGMTERRWEGGTERARE